jgi:hypothetical protein
MQIFAHKCDFCRGPVGPIALRYWRMRFCSTAHRKAYQDRLAEGTRTKIRLLADVRATAEHEIGSRAAA